jgi:RNA polymerase sigma-70 factor (ECF subfamily)
VQRGLDHALDEYLVLLAQDGSKEAAERLIVRWSPKLLAFAGRTLGSHENARDVVQNTWESALRNLRKLDDPARFAGWLYAIIARKCTDEMRGKYRRRRLTEAIVPQPADYAAGPNADAALDLQAALQLLPSEQRVAVSLYFGEGLSVGEIAVITGVPAGTVKSRLFAARRTLRACIDGEEQ